MKEKEQLRARSWLACLFILLSGYKTDFGVGLTCVHTLGIDVLERPLGSQFCLCPGSCCLPLTATMGQVGGQSPHTNLLDVPDNFANDVDGCSSHGSELGVVLTLSVVSFGVHRCILEEYTRIQKMLNSPICAYASILKKKKKKH